MKRAHFSSPSDNEQGSSSDVDNGFQFASAGMPECLVRELRKQSAFAQQQAGQDVYGIGNKGSGVNIGTEQVQELWQEIQKIEHKAAWDQAMELNPEYPCSLMIPFLHSVDGSPKKAAKRITRHFETKLELFGSGKLAKPIEIDDFDEDDLEALHSGGFQVLPSKDRGGRPMLFGRYTCMRYKDVKNMIRVLFYLWCTMVEEEEHQKSGIVAIGFENGKLPLERIDYSGDDNDFDPFSSMDDGGIDRNLVRGILVVPMSIPVRPMGFHICADSNQWEGIFDMVVSTLCRFLRMRIRIHYGTMQENKYAMMTHGIPVDSIPVTPEGEVDLTNHKLWIQHRMELEAERRERGAYVASSWSR